MVSGTCVRYTRSEGYASSSAGSPIKLKLRLLVWDVIWSEFFVSR